MIRDLLLLARAPLAAGAVGNLLVGVALAAPAGFELSGSRLAALVALALATCALYWGGMVLNDWFDRARDLELAPHRPLPAGRVAPGLAAGLGFGLLAAGVALAALGALLGGSSPLRGALGGGTVALCVLAYDGGLKRVRFPGALAMGACRFSNALLGAFALGLWSPDALLDPAAGWGVPCVLYAVALWVYVTFLTFLSTYEEERAGALAMTLGFGGTLLAPGLLVALPMMGQGWHPLGLVGALALFALVLANLILAILEGTRARGQATTRSLLQGLWLLDLSVLLARCSAWLLLGWGALFIAYKLGAKALFGPPPGKAETSGPSPDTMAAHATPQPPASPPAPEEQ